MLLKDIKSNGYKLIQGKASKRIHGIYLFNLFIFMFIFFIASFLLYPNYSILMQSVSSLGVPGENPQGYWIWGVGMIISGIILIPHFLYIYRALHRTAHKSSIINLVLSILSSLGITGVGIFSEDTVIPHYSCAGFTFFGLFTAFCFNLYILTKKIKDGDDWPKKWNVFVIYFQLFFGMIGFLSSLGLYGLYYFKNISWFNMHLPLWEWILFTVNMLYLIGIYFIIQEFD